MRVINLGLPKSGTTSFAEAMAKAGLNVADHRIRKGQTATPALVRNFVGQVLYRGFYNSGDPLEELQEFDAVAEASFLHAGRQAWPQMDHALLMAIRARHPQVKFTATRRDAGKLANSMMRWTNMAARLEGNALPGLPVGFGGTEAHLARWIDGHYAHLATLFEGDPNYLELDVAAPEAQQRLQAFLGFELPWWGRANENTARPEEDEA
ncbi:MAG: sulfotransferase family protein [Rhodobacteraceae bacterium]|nr:sulfotransferase family protein [Paracoccaceae bacterium]MBR9819415.1 sulfotransferase family protein [Paracoccaceae bacterium]